MRKIYIFLLNIIQIFWISATIFAGPAIPQQGETPSGIPFPRLEEAIDNYAELHVGTSTPGAVVAVVKDGSVIFSKGYGYKNISSGEKVDSESTIFEWGSITKLFTWTSLMQLEEQGIIALDDDIRMHLPEPVVKSLKHFKPVTILDLMNHTGGFGDFPFDVIYTSGKGDDKLVDAILKCHPEQYMDVGSASAYSNYGAALAGLIVEHKTGKSFNEYLAENFYNPLGMSRTTADPNFYVSEEVKSDKAFGYRRDGEGGFSEGPWSCVNLAPAGSLNGPVGDLAKFAIALTPGEGETPLFKLSDTLGRMLETSYFNSAHGFFKYGGETDRYGHGGNTASFTSQFVIVPEENFAVITLTNMGGEMEFAYGLQELLTGGKTPGLERDNRDLPDVAEVEGEYYPFRRPEGSFLEMMSFTLSHSVKAIGENEILLKQLPFMQKYVQTAPYLYEVADDSTPRFSVLYPKLLFEVEKGKVVQMTVGNGCDLQPMELASSSFSRVVSLLISVLFVLSCIAGIIMTLLSMFGRGYRKSASSRRSYNLLQLGSSLMGVILISSNGMALAKFMSTFYVAFSSIRPYFILNYAYVILLFLLHGISLKLEKNSSLSVPRRLFDRGHFLVTVLMVFVMYYWNFFKIYL